jgi:Flp pilus assembly protein TadG
MTEDSGSGIRNDSGAVAVLFAIIFAVLLIPLIAGAIDLTRVRVTVEELQDDLNTAAVSAATTFGTSGSLSQAQTAGVRTMGLNQWTITTADVTNASSSTSGSCRAVRIVTTATIPMFFAQTFNIRSISVTRTAYGIYHDWSLSSSTYSGGDSYSGGSSSSSSDCSFNVAGAAPRGTYQNGEVEIINSR